MVGSFQRRTFFGKEKKGIHKQDSALFALLCIEHQTNKQRGAYKYGQVLWACSTRNPKNGFARIAAKHFGRWWKIELVPTGGLQGASFEAYGGGAEATNCTRRGDKVYGFANEVEC